MFPSASATYTYPTTLSQDYQDTKMQRHGIRSAALRWLRYHDFKVVSVSSLRIKVLNSLPLCPPAPLSGQRSIHWIINILWVPNDCLKSNSVTTSISDLKFFASQSLEQKHSFALSSYKTSALADAVADIQPLDRAQYNITTLSSQTRLSIL